MFWKCNKILETNGRNILGDAKDINRILGPIRFCFVNNFSELQFEIFNSELNFFILYVFVSIIWKTSEFDCWTILYWIWGKKMQIQIKKYYDNFNS